MTAKSPPAPEARPESPEPKLGSPTSRSMSPFRHFTAEEWGKLRADTPLTLSEADLDDLRGWGENVSLEEVREIYLPLSRLLNLYVAATQELFGATSKFLGTKHAKTPFIIGVAGSVAVGKSTTARIISELLARWPNHPKVDLVTTDGFLYPNAVLEERELMGRKGFPESFDVKRLISFLTDIKAGARNVEAPVYSHFHYDIIGETITVDQPDVLVVEGLNVLQSWKPAEGEDPQPFVSDFFDFSIYLDADEDMIREWYVNRFLGLRKTSFKNPDAYFHRYASLGDNEAVEVATSIWTSINLANLNKNILPTRERADLVLRKGPDHAIRDVFLRKL
ncbi:MAG: type I pantothenate kinase [Alphaproteobacteria bacterium]|nr:type I pantothenate kinase [Rhodobiaceae bacterium]MBO6543153.1 type I pantothenate kinase [Alphaproteobacteria bacterium]MBO6626920.1 type I pantothenate kinase [Alphaproteobacteria bacterium]